MRAAFAAVDGGVHVHPFFDMHDLGDALVRAGFADPVLDVERYTVQYESFEALTTDLKALGARNTTLSRGRGLLSPRRLRLVREHYEGYRRGGRLPATAEVVFAHAWARSPKVAKRAQVVSLEVLRGQLPSRR
jgi:malonyl-CoA O-methyltransferase